MEMYTEEIYQTAEKLIGDAPENLETLCRMAEQEISARIKPNVSMEECKDAFIQAAAMIAAAIYRGAKGGTEDVSAYRAGSVSVTKRVSESGGNYESLRRQAELIMAPYIYDSGFSFIGVKG